MLGARWGIGMRTGTAKHITAAEAAGLVESGMWLDFGVALCQPDVFDQALAARTGT
jgi:acyl-CoA hydrolase